MKYPWNKKPVWISLNHVSAMVMTDEIEFIGENKETMLLDGRDVIYLHHVDEKELFSNNEGEILWKTCSYDKAIVEQAIKIQDALEAKDKGDLKFYMPDFNFPLAVVGQDFTIFISPRMRHLGAEPLVFGPTPFPMPRDDLLSIEREEKTKE